jgi:MFS transporter, DHA2 family, methylenomycin A resistance protein
VSVPTVSKPAEAPASAVPAGWALAAAVLGFFVITLHAVVVTVALPSIRADLGGGVSGLQWVVVDGYTLILVGLGGPLVMAVAKKAFTQAGTPE